MIRKVALSVALLTLASTAFAAEPEQVVVRNRLYSDASRLEVKVLWDTSLNNSLTSMNNLQLSLSYHLSEAWALELIGGYAFGGPTDLFCQAQNPSTAATCDAGTHSIFTGAQQNNRQFQSDFPNLWVMNGPNVLAGVRWEPVYGKLSLLTELPIHFKWFLSLDGGAAQFQRNSLDFCTSYNPTLNSASAGVAGSPGDCTFNSSMGIYTTLQQIQWNWLASAATGLRFIVISGLSLEAAVRDYVWADSYPVGFSGNQFPTGTGTTPSSTLPNSVKMNNGLSNNIFADLGLSWTF